MYKKKRSMLCVLLAVLLVNTLMFSINYSQAVETTDAVLTLSTPTPRSTLPAKTPLPIRPIPTTFPKNPPVSDELPYDTIIYFPDYVLETSIRYKINKSSGEIYYRDVKNIESLSLNSVFDFEGIQFLTNLQSLGAGSNEEKYSLDLSALGQLKQLNSLNLDYYTTTSSDLNCLKGLTNLSTLYLNAYKVRDLKALGYMRNLEYLYIIKMVDLNLEPLSLLDNLKDLTIFSTSIENLDKFKVLNNLSLTNLKIRSKRLNSISGIAGLKNLKYLDLGGNKNINDLRVLSNFTSLTTLELSGNAIIDINPLANLTNLSTLHLQSNCIMDISPLADLTNLTDLFLQNNEIVDASPLSNLTNLEYANLLNNPGLDKSTLENLPENANVIVELPQSPSQSPSPTPRFRTPEPFVPREPVFDLGDVNVDGKVDSIDFAYMRMCLLGIIKELPYEQFTDTALGDLNSDGIFNSIDFAKMRQYLTGTIKQF